MKIFFSIAYIRVLNFPVFIMQYKQGEPTFGLYQMLAKGMKNSYFASTSISFSNSYLYLLRCS
jgi:hypothetical protein